MYFDPDTWKRVRIIPFNTVWQDVPHIPAPASPGPIFIPRIY